MKKEEDYGNIANVVFLSFFIKFALLIEALKIYTLVLLEIRFKSFTDFREIIFFYYIFRDLITVDSFVALIVMK